MFSGESLYDKDVAKYVMRAMKAVDEEYTKRSKAAGEVVKQHLKKNYLRMYRMNIKVLL